MSRLQITGIAPQIVVADVIRTAEYYRDVLGFWESDGDAIQCNDAIRKGTPDFVIWVQEIEKLFEEFRGVGNANIVQEITERSYGR